MNLLACAAPEQGQEYTQTNALNISLDFCFSISIHLENVLVAQMPICPGKVHLQVRIDAINGVRQNTLRTALIVGFKAMQTNGLDKTRLKFIFRWPTIFQ